jgi:hypothetical protein
VSSADGTASDAEASDAEDRPEAPDAAEAEEVPDATGTTAEESAAEAAAAAYREELRSAAALANDVPTGSIGTPALEWLAWQDTVVRRRERWWRRDKRRPSGAVPADEVEAELRMKTAAVRSAESDVTLKKVVGYGALLFMVLQIVAADAVFYIYGHHRDWDIPAEVISFWLGSTVVQVAVIVRTVATYLFPSSGGSR